MTILAFAYGNSSAQNIFPTNAKWTGVHMTNRTYNWPYRPDSIKYTYFSYIIQGDTIIDNIVRSKLYYEPDINLPDIFLIGYFHIKGDTVFYRKHEIEPGVFAEGLYEICDEYELDYPLYNFSLQKGDSIIDLYSYCSESGDIKREVADVQYIEFGGIDRKKIIFHEYSDFYWLEGMGSVYGFFYGKEKDLTSVDEMTAYICFSVDDEVLYMHPHYSECANSRYNTITELKVIPSVPTEKDSILFMTDSPPFSGRCKYRLQVDSIKNTVIYISGKYDSNWKCLTKGMDVVNIGLLNEGAYQILYNFIDEYVYGAMPPIPTETYQLNFSVTKYEEIADIKNKNRIDVYPNPCRSDVTIAFPTNDLNCKTIQLYDSFGSLVYSRQICRDKLLMNMNLYDSGVYFLKVLNQEYVNVVKIIKQ